MCIVGRATDQALLHLEARPFDRVQRAIVIPRKSRKKEYQFREADWSESKYEYRYIDKGRVAIANLDDPAQTVYFRLQLGDGFCMATRDHWTGYDRLANGYTGTWLPPEEFIERYLRPIAETIAD